ncbi:MAG: 5-formyltetrahydrofolate cyclo-ligase [Verrucomicrobiota bacterium]|nr:5-formyltetrahydrofolate cyclo-ligase [Verrucomicrobiota bacterium]
MHEDENGQPQKQGSIFQQKDRLRRIQHSLASKMSAEDRRKQSLGIRHSILKHPCWKAARRVLAFIPMLDEPDIFPLFQTTLESGKTLCLPRFSETAGNYHPAAIKDLTQDLLPGRYGIQEPHPACQREDLSHMDLTLVPGLAFDRRGWRLGRGKGYYDQLLSTQVGIRCGIALNFQWVESVPNETLDQKMNWIITPGDSVKVVSR